MAGLQVLRCTISLFPCHCSLGHLNLFPVLMSHPGLFAAAWVGTSACITAVCAHVRTWPCPAPTLTNPKIIPTPMRYINIYPLLLYHFYTGLCDPATVWVVALGALLPGAALGGAGAGVWAWRHRHGAWWSRQYTGPETSPVGRSDLGIARAAFSVLLSVLLVLAAAVAGAFLAHALPMLALGLAAHKAYKAWTVIKFEATMSARFATSFSGRYGEVGGSNPGMHGSGRGLAAVGSTSSMQRVASSRRSATALAGSSTISGGGSSAEQDPKPRGAPMQRPSPAPPVPRPPSATTTTTAVEPIGGLETDKKQQQQPRALLPGSSLAKQYSITSVGANDGTTITDFDHDGAASTAHATGRSEGGDALTLSGEGPLTLPSPAGAVTLSVTGAGAGGEDDVQSFTVSASGTGPSIFASNAPPGIDSDNDNEDGHIQSMPFTTLDSPPVVPPGGTHVGSTDPGAAGSTVPVLYGMRASGEDGGRVSGVSALVQVQVGVAHNSTVAAVVRHIFTVFFIEFDMVHATGPLAWVVIGLMSMILPGYGYVTAALHIAFIVVHAWLYPSYTAMDETRPDHAASRPHHTQFGPCCPIFCQTFCNTGRRRGRWPVHLPPPALTSTRTKGCASGGPGQCTARKHGRTR